VDIGEDSLMAFSEEWEREQYSKGKQVNIYPFTDIVCLVMAYANPDEHGFGQKVLELGCGTGPNIQFFFDKQMEYFGIEGSASAVEWVKRKFGDYASITQCDFTSKIPFEADFFDLIVDRSAITHNRKDDIVKVIEECHRVLKNGGVFVITDWFSTKHSLCSEGDDIELNTKSNYSRGLFANVGTVHYFDESEIRELFSSGWEIRYLAHKTVEVYISEIGNVLGCTYNLVAAKKGEQL